MFTKDSKLKVIMKNPQAKEVLQKHIPSSTKDTRFKMAANMGMTVASLQQHSEGKLTDEMLDALDADLRALGD